MRMLWKNGKAVVAMVVVHVMKQVIATNLHGYKILWKEMHTVLAQKFDTYTTFPKEKSRPPSRGGNTKALHSHCLTFGGESYSFLGLGSKQWAYKSDLVSFEFEIKGEYKNIIPESLVTIERNGKEVFRGERGYKKTLRTVESRLPASRRELNSFN